MADENIITNLIVNGGQKFITTHLAAAEAQDKLTNAIRQSSTVKTEILVEPILEYVKAAGEANTTTKQFKNALNAAFAENDLPKRAGAVTNAIKAQTQAIQENEAALARISENRSANLANNLQSTQASISKTITQTGGFVQPSDLIGSASDADRAKITQHLEQQRTAFLEKETLVRNAIEERALVAARARAENRVKIEQQALNDILGKEEQRARRTAQIQEAEAERARATRLTSSEQSRRQNNAQDIFTSQHPEFNAATATTLKVGSETNKSTAAVKELGTSFDVTGAKGVTYLSSLSAIHAASFLLSGNTFTAVGSLSTLGLAFGKLAPEGSKASLAFSTLGIGIGAILGGFNALGNAVGQIINVTEAGANSLLQLAAAATVAGTAVVAASVKLASSAEDVFAEIAAFGEPTKAQFTGIEEGVSGIARKFGQSATSVAEGASLFIRAGGKITDSINENIAAVTRLTIASRKELIPEQSARAVVTVTNAFKQFNVTADQAVDVIVGVAQKSALSFSEVTQAFQQAAPTAALLKIPLLDLAASIGVLANEGLRGQVAGTGLKQFLLDLLRPSKEAKDKLQELGISIQDTSGKIRPLHDIFNDLKRALGEEADAVDKSGDASKAQALAIIFGSRANLAAAIIARTGAEAFNDLKESIAGVSAVEVVNTLLSTTSAQVGIATTNIQELARAFGGPLNVAIGEALKSVNQFLLGIDRGPFETAAQSIIAVFTGGGFSKVSEVLNNLDNSRAKEFFTSLLNTALTLRNTFVSQLIPAFEGAGSAISNAIGNINISETFRGIATAGNIVIEAVARVVTVFGTVVSSFITGNEEGQKLRNTLAGVATGVATALVGSFVALAVPLVIAVKLLSAVGQAMIELLSTQNKFNSIWQAGWEIAKQSVANFVKDASPQLYGLGQITIGIATKDLATIQKGFENIDKGNFGAAAANIAKEYGGVDNALTNVGATLDDVTKQISNLQTQRQALEIQRANTSGILGLPSQLDLQRQITAIDEQLGDLADRRKTLFGTFSALNQAKQTPDLSLNILGTISSASAEIEAIRNRPPINLDDILNFGEGDLPSSLTAVAAKLKEIEDAARAAREPERDTTEAGFAGDPKKEAQISREIADIVRNTEQEITDLRNDSATRREQQERQFVDKVFDLNDGLNRDLRRIDERTNLRKQQADQQRADQLVDRDALKVVTRRFELESFLREQANAKRDQLTARQDAAEDRLNQQRVQDNDSVLSHIENREQRSQDIIDQIRDRGFQRQQQQEERAFSRQQSREETAFSRQLQNAATNRDNQLKLAAAKTPQERSDLQKQIQEASANTRFSRQQEDQLTAFRLQQEDKRVTFQQKQEDVAFQQQIKNEQAAFDFRIGLERKYIDIRRQLETDEIIRNSITEDDRFRRRVGLSRQDFDFRNTQADRLQTEQDKLDQGRHDRENERIQETANLEKKERIQTFSEAVFGLVEDANRQRLTSEEQAQSRLRDIVQRGQRGLIQLGEREPTAKSATEQALIRLDAELIITRTLLEQNTALADNFFSGTARATLLGAGAPLEAPARHATFAIPEFDAETQRAMAQAQALSVAPLLAQIIPPTVAAAIGQVQAQGQGDKTLNIYSPINTEQALQLLRNYLFSQR